MIKRWNDFIREFVDNYNNSIIDVKMTELKDLIDSFGSEDNLLYEWENDNDHEVIINFTYNDLSIKYEFSVDDMRISKITDDKVDFSEGVGSIDEALDIIEKDVHKILGVSESKIFEGSYDSSLKRNDILPIVNKIEKISKLSIDDSADIEGLISDLEKSLYKYDEDVIEDIVDMILFSPDDKEYMINKIIKLGDEILSRYGTEPKMILYAFEDAFTELSKQFKID